MAEPSYYTGVLASAAGANKRHLTLFNAAGSGRIVKVYNISAAPAPIAAVTGLVIPLHAVRITGAPTGGTDPAIGKNDTVDDANLPAQVTAMAAATGGATESGPPFAVGAVSGEETQSGCFGDLYRADGTKPMVLREGQGVLVKQGALASAGNVHITIGFTAI